MSMGFHQRSFEDFSDHASCREAPYQLQAGCSAMFNATLIGHNLKHQITIAPRTGRTAIDTGEHVPVIGNGGAVELSVRALGFGKNAHETTRKRSTSVL